MENQRPTFCPSCGKPNPPSSKFCSYCGQNLEAIHDFGTPAPENATKHSPGDVKDQETGTQPTETPPTQLVEEDSATDIIETPDPISDLTEIAGTPAQDVDHAHSSTDDPDMTDAGGAPGEIQPIKSSSGKGKKLFTLLFIVAIISLIIKFTNPELLQQFAEWATSGNKKQQTVIVHFVSSESGFKVLTSRGEQLTAAGNTVNYMVTPDSIPDIQSIGFDFSKPNYISHSQYSLDLTNLIYTDGKYEKTVNVNFSLKPTNVSFRVSIKWYVEGAFITINGSKFLLQSKAYQTFGPYAVKSRTAFNFSTGIDNDEQHRYKISSPKALFVDPGKGDQTEALQLNVTYGQPATFNFLVVDEFIRPVENADIMLNYNGISGKTDKDGKITLVVEEPAIDLKISPQVKKGAMFPMATIPTAEVALNSLSFNYTVKLKLQDVIKFRVEDLNGNPLSNVTIKSKDQVMIKATDANGQGLIVTKDRGKTVEFTASRKGYQSQTILVNIQPGETVAPPFQIQSNQVKLAIQDMFSKKSIPDVSVKFDDGRNIQTNTDQYQILNDIVLNDNYHITLKDLNGNYINAESTIRPTTVGEFIVVEMEPKPRVISVHFQDDKGRNLADVKTKFSSDHGIKHATTGKSGKVEFRVYKDSLYTLGYEWGGAGSEELILTDNQWQISRLITLRKSGKLTVTASPGSPQIKIRDPDTQGILGEGSAKLVKNLKFGGYQIETDCGGFINKQPYTLNSFTATLKINCEHPWIVGSRYLAEENWSSAESEFNKVPSSDPLYCEAQSELFRLHSESSKLPNVSDAQDNAERLLGQGCQILRKPTEAMRLGEFFVAQNDFNRAEDALLDAKKYVEAVPENQRNEVVERIDYFMILNDHKRALESKGSNRCDQLRTVFGRWVNFNSHVENATLKVRTQAMLNEAEEAFRRCN